MDAAASYETLAKLRHTKQRHVPKEGTLQWEIGFQITEKVNRCNFDTQTEKD
jgi:hypothetical protein